MANNIHFILQGKGGVGKSFVAAVLAQFLTSVEEELLVIDTDPVNRTLAGFEALHAHEIQLMSNNNIDQSKFDKLMGLVLDHEGDSIVDNGASSFVTLSSYLLENDMPEFLMDEGKKVTIHTIVTGGQALYDTLQGMNSVVQQFPDACQMVVWLNEFWGPIEEMGYSFEQMPAYQNNQERIDAIVTVAKQSELFEQATKLMLKKRMTFAEVEACTNAELFDAFKKRRIAKLKNILFGQLAALRQGGVL